MAASCAASRPHSWIGCPSRASRMASAVPQLPAPITVIGSARRVCIRGSLVNQTRLRRSRRLGQQGVEIDQRQDKIWKAALDDQVGNDFARKWKQHAGTEAADQAL